MRRAAKWVGVALGTPLLLAALLLAAVLGGSATPPGRAAIEHLVPVLTDGAVRVSGLSGWLFGAARVARIEVSDKRGRWLTIEGLTLAWSPLRLFAGEAVVQRLAADRVAVARRPLASGSNFTLALPVRLDIAALHIARLDLAAPVLRPTGDQIGDQTGERTGGQTAALEVDGAARVLALDQGTMRLALRRLDLQGSYDLDASLDPAGLHATLHVAEPAGGLLGTLAALPAIGAIAAEATLAGPLDAIATQATLTAGALRARVTGRLDLTGRAADLAVTAEAPAMAPRPDLAWQGISLTGSLHGAFAKPDANVRLVANGLVLGQAGIGRITADIQGNSGRLTLDGALDNIRLPGARPDVLADAPLLVAATLRLDAADRPLAFRLHHRLFTIEGTAATAGAQQAQVQLAVPALAPLAAAAGIDLSGDAALSLHAARHGADTQLAVQGRFGLTNGPGPAAALLGPDTRLDAHATLRGRTLHLSQLGIASSALSASMTGTAAPDALDLDWHLAIADLAAVSPTLSGPLRASGKASGVPADLTVSAALTGEIGAKGIAPGAVSAQVALAGLPDAPTGHIVAQGTLLGAKLSLDVAASRENGRVRVAIERAEWKSAHAEGTLLVDPAAPLPLGRLSFAMTRLDDLQPLLGAALGGSTSGAGQPGGATSGGATSRAGTSGGGALRGSLSGTLDSTAAGASLTVTATDAGLPGTATVARATLDARLADPLAHPRLDGHLTLDGLAAGGISGAARIEAKGPLDAPALRLAATLPALAGAPAQVEAAGTLDTANRTVTLASLTAEWRQTPIRLLAPARIGFAAGVAVEKLRLGLAEAVLEANGRLTPALDLTARLRGLPAGLAVRLAALADLVPATPAPSTPAPANPTPANPPPATPTPATAALATPPPALDGTLDAEARLTGTLARPTGTLRVTARGLRAATGPGRAMPAAAATLTATMQGNEARVDLRATAGTTRLTVTGEVPLTAAGALDLRATGALDLATTDPLLTQGGQRARGRVSLDATVTGPLAAPTLAGEAHLADGSFRDFAQGIDIAAISASLAADGGTVRLTRFAAKAGPGTIEAHGTLELTAPGRPLDLTITAHNARPLASDLLTAELDADLTLRGELMPSGEQAGRLTAGGHIFVRHADIRVPERLPAGIAVLNVRVAGARPPPRPAPQLRLALDLAIEAPQQIFVRGRGVNAEMGGSVRLRGSTIDPIPSGGFALRRGQYRHRRADPDLHHRPGRLRRRQPDRSVARLHRHHDDRQRHRHARHHRHREPPEDHPVERAQPAAGRGAGLSAGTANPRPRSARWRSRRSWRPSPP